MKILRYMILGLIVIALILTAVIACNKLKEADRQLVEVEKKIQEHMMTATQRETEPETVSLSYEEYLEQKTQLSEENATFIEENTTSATEVDLYSMDVWTLGAYLYGIPEYDTTRALVLITYEGYHDSPLSYYVACCCWVRATEGYWGYGNLYSAFGEADTSYNEWMDDLGYSEWAVEHLRQCYLNPTYVKYCNGMTEPWDYIYYENGIYVWN